MVTVLFLAAALLVRFLFPRWKPGIPWICPVLTLALPFCAGGFHTGTNAVLSAFLMLALLEDAKKQRCLRFCRNSGSLALGLLLAAFCAAPLWAADRGMALLALPRYLPVMLFALLVMQEEQLPSLVLKQIPLCGCGMTLIALILSLFPGLSGYVTVNGRLAGFFQYPNSFAAFLLCGLILQSLGSKSKWDLPVIALLAVGIVLSGSKTVFVLTAVFVLVLLLVQRQKRLFVIFAAALILGLGAGYLADALGLLTQADRFTEISPSSGTFLVRLLYYWDALPAIASHPFGIGYLGYPAIRGLLQSGRYYVTYLHNGFLQILLETGWLPGLLLAFTFVSTLLKRDTPLSRRLLLPAILAHCMLDFDLQFSAFWILILCCLDLSRGKIHTLPFRKTGYLLAAVLTAVSLWLGCGDWAFRLGRNDLCLALTPFHTQALEQALTQSKDATEVDALADRILSLSPTNSLACSAKANAAFSRGDMLSMITHKENAIRFNPYTLEEYLDYIRKLYTALELYLKAGDQNSALYCRNKLLEIPGMIEAVSQKTSPLAYRTGDDPSLILPVEYADLLDALKPK